MKTILDIITPIKLLSGSHSDTAQTGQGCAMNVIAYLNGEDQITDKSPCVCVTVRKPLIWLNDYLKDSERQELVPYLLRAMGSATDDEIVINARLVHVVQFANVMADIAKRAANATYAYAYAATNAYAAAATNAANAAANAANATYAANAAAYAATNAANATYAAANATYAANAAANAANATYAANAAANAANAAANAATYAAYANAAYRSEIKAAGFAFLNAVLPQAAPVNETVFIRAKNLAALVEIA